ncbi:MAG: hypothetical protein PVI92_00845 [Chromatiales bacterium]|jgi:hypothetical protein
MESDERAQVDDASQHGGESVAGANPSEAALSLAEVVARAHEKSAEADAIRRNWRKEANRSRILSEMVGALLCQPGSKVDVHQIAQAVRKLMGHCNAITDEVLKLAPEELRTDSAFRAQVMRHVAPMLADLWKARGVIQEEHVTTLINYLAKEMKSDLQADTEACQPLSCGVLEYACTLNTVAADFYANLTEWKPALFGDSDRLFQQIIGGDKPDMVALMDAIQALVDARVTAMLGAIDPNARLRPVEIRGMRQSVLKQAATLGLAILSYEKGELIDFIAGMTPAERASIAETFPQGVLRPWFLDRLTERMALLPAVDLPSTLKHDGLGKVLGKFQSERG